MNNLFIIKTVKDAVCLIQARVNRWVNAYLLRCISMIMDYLKGFLGSTLFQIQSRFWLLAKPLYLTF
jgi:hypothetical protein